MSDPVLQTSYWVGYYQCDRDPTSSEPLCYTGIPDFLEPWWNTASGDIFFCVDNTPNAMVWNKLITNANIVDILTALGVYQSTNRPYVQRSSPAFSTSYQPSTTSDTLVALTLNFTGLLSLSSTVNIEVSQDNSTWQTIFSIVKSLSIGGNENDPVNFTVPIGSHYRIVQAAGTAASIVSIYELGV